MAKGREALTRNDGRSVDIASASFISPRHMMFLVLEHAQLYISTAGREGTALTVLTNRGLGGSPPRDRA